MSEFDFQIGDKITRPGSDADEWFEIEWLKGELLAGVDQNGDEDWWRTCHVAEWSRWVSSGRAQAVDSHHSVPPVQGSSVSSTCGRGRQPNE